MKILLAEDDFYSGNFVKKMLEKLSHKVILAENGLKAWKLFQQSDVRMVITDWMMPQMDGVTLCRKIRAADSSRYVYLILLTAKDRKEDAVVGLEAGADDYIIKPFEPEELRARIRVGERIIRLERERKRANTQLLQSEKMASVGQLAAGVAHEINNPAGFVSSNLKTLSEYIKDLNDLIKEYRKITAELKENTAADGSHPAISEQVERITALEDKVDIDFIMNDILELIEENREGTERIKNIVQNLKDFAHPGADKPKFADINKNLDSTVNVVQNELKYKADVIKDYGDLPQVQCYPQLINQVFVNILVNAAQSIKKRGEIRIKTLSDNGYVEIKISDTGSGIPQENLSRIFDPFFTTKEVGKGTGLGLNVAYNIIKKHQGIMDVQSDVGKGTTFTIRLPVGDN